MIYLNREADTVADAPEGTVVMKKSKAMKRARGKKPMKAMPKDKDTWE